MRKYPLFVRVLPKIRLRTWSDEWLPRKAEQRYFLGMSRAIGSLLFAATACFTVTLLVHDPAAAQEPAAAKKATAAKKTTAAQQTAVPQRPAASQKATAPQKTATETPRDPEGVTGISPFWESLNQGDAAFLAQDLDGATKHYQAAITGAPKNPIGHLRMAEVSLKQNELARAQEFLTAALRFAETGFGEKDFRVNASASFLMAQLRERQAVHDDAKEAWNGYKALASQLPAEKPKSAKGPRPPHIYVETADSRIAAIDAKKKLDEEYAAVRTRIQANIDKADSVTGAAAGSKKDD